MRNLILSIGALIAFGPLAAAAGPLCGDTPIKLAFFDYGLYFDNGKGIDKDLADELEHRSSCAFDRHVMARARIWNELKAGTLDLAFSGLESPERDEFAWFVPYLAVKNFAVLRKEDKTLGINSASDFLARPRLRFGAVRSFIHGQMQDRWLDELREKNRVVDYAESDLLFRNLKGGRIDATFADPLVFRRAMSDFDMQDELAIEDWTPEERGTPVNVIFAKSRFGPAELAQWQGILHDMINDGTMRKIFERYMSAAEAEAILTF